MFQKNGRAPFNSRNSHYSSVVSEALGSRSPNLPCTGAQLPACAFSSAPAKRCLPRCGHQAAAPEYLESFACCLCTVCSPTAIQNHHLEANLQKRNLLLCFDLFLQPSCRPATGPGRSLPSPPPPWRETPPRVRHMSRLAPASGGEGNLVADKCRGDGDCFAPPHGGARGGPEARRLREVATSVALSTRGNLFAPAHGRTPVLGEANLCLKPSVAMGALRGVTQSQDEPCKVHSPPAQRQAGEAWTGQRGCERRWLAASFALGIQRGKADPFMKA